MNLISRIHNSCSITTVNSVGALTGKVLRGASIESKRLVINDLAAFWDCIPTLVANVVDFGVKSAPEPVRAMSAWIINQAAQQRGVKLNSPNSLYTAVADGKIDRQFAVPAINIRGNSLDTARALFAAANGLNVGALIVEIARSEMGYTNQAPREFAAVVQAAAMMEGWEGQLFLQGDHIQLSKKKVTKGGPDATQEERAHSALIRECLKYGFGSIDLDMSPFEQRNKTELSFDDQQRLNYLLTASKILEIRRLQLDLNLPYTVMLGGETGEVGESNTRREDIEAYAQGLVRELKRLHDKTGLPLQGIRKIAVQTGTHHGGVTLPDGSVKQVKIEFEVLKMAREESLRYGWAGPVQHGASTLPDEVFSKFVEYGAAEVHLATGFQNILFEVGIAKEQGLKAAIERFIGVNFISEWKEDTSWLQFFTDNRKRANGPFKWQLWTMPEEVREAVSDALVTKFKYIFQALGVQNTQGMVNRFVKDVDFELPYPEAGETIMVDAAETDRGGADLAD
ncbi:MAG: class II fructose-bisphosphate aldolase [Candidatus Margulisbacteria bacterium]|nr:class II fructose-bisphosphate aldolase [Candidatus Margulisiibacteriota bacterium]